MKWKSFIPLSVRRRRSYFAAKYGLCIASLAFSFFVLLEYVSHGFTYEAHTRHIVVVSLIVGFVGFCATYIIIWYDIDEMRENQMSRKLKTFCRKVLQ